MDRLSELINDIDKFIKDRDWNQFHSPANLAKSISIEAGELLECFQWDESNYNKDNVLEALADVFNYCLQLSIALNVDPITITAEKLKETASKYPIEKSKGVSIKYNKL